MNEEELKRTISDEYDKLDDRFHISNEYEKTQIISGLYKYLNVELKKNKRLSVVNDYYKKICEYAEEFLIIELKDFMKKTGEIDFRQILEREKYYPENRGFYCMYCSSKDACLKIEQ